MSPRRGSAEPVGELVDDQPILIGQRRRHALALDARHLEAERDDQRGVDGRRDQRLHPGDQLVAHLSASWMRAALRHSGLPTWISERRRERQLERASRRRPRAAVTASGTPAAGGSATG